MNLNKLAGKIETEIKDRKVAENIARAFENIPEDFRLVVEAWLDGQVKDFEFQGITLAAIQEKEKCSYLQAILRMQTLITTPILASGYLRWFPVNKDRGR